MRPLALVFWTGSILLDRSSLNTLFTLHQRDNFLEVVHHRFEFGDRFGGEVLRVGEFVARFQRVVLQPGDVELVRPLGDLACVVFG